MVIPVLLAPLSSSGFVSAVRPHSTCRGIKHIKGTLFSDWYIPRDRKNEGGGRVNQVLQVTQDPGTEP